MAHYIIPQPNGNFSLYSSISDTFLVVNLSKDELIGLEVKDAKYQAEVSTKERLEIAFNKLKTKGPVITYEEALANHNENTQ